jgi:hypothetical protein
VLPARHEIAHLVLLARHEISHLVLPARFEIAHLVLPIIHMYIVLFFFRIYEKKYFDYF